MKLFLRAPSLWAVTTIHGSLKQLRHWIFRFVSRLKERLRVSKSNILRASLIACSDFVGHFHISTDYSRPRAPTTKDNRYESTPRRSLSSQSTPRLHHPLAKERYNALRNCVWSGVGGVDHDRHPRLPHAIIRRDGVTYAKSVPVVAFHGGSPFDRLIQ